MEALAVRGGKPVRDRFLVFGAPDVREPEILEVVETLRSGWLSTGPRCQRFEQLFKDYIGCRHAISLNSCTAGLELALEVAGVGAGDEVITSPLTFCATANVIVHRGAKPVFVDVDRETGLIDPTQVEKAVTSRTKAIIPVHLYGQPCALDDLMALARARGLAVVEDAAHATEAWYRGRKIGTIGDATAFSFYATKNLVTGEGGMLVTDRDELAEEVRVRRLHGLTQDAWKRYSVEGFQPYDVISPGYKYNMMDIQAALGIHQLSRLEENLKVRERHWATYDEAFARLEEVRIPSRIDEERHRPSTRHARHLYTIILDLNRLSLSRWEFVSALKAENIGTGVHFVAVHLFSFYRKAYGYKLGDFPNAEFIAERTLSLPLSSALTDEDVQDVVRAMEKVVTHARRV